MYLSVVVTIASFFLTLFYRIGITVWRFMLKPVFWLLKLLALLLGAALIKLVVWVIQWATVELTGAAKELRASRSAQ